MNAHEGLNIRPWELTVRNVDDIVRARLRTLGVEEHRFTMESGEYAMVLSSCNSLKKVRRVCRIGMVHL